MKKIFLLLMLAILTTSAKSQDTTVYQSVFGDSITKWEGILVNNAVNQFLQYTKCDDTAIIDGQKYYILRDGNSCMYTHFDYHYVRESETHDKLYVRYHENDYSEILVMDLTLQVGDTLNTESWKHCGSLGNKPAQTITIDSIFYVDGRKIMRTNCIAPHDFYCHTEYDTLFFIEGVGPSMGVCFPYWATQVDDDGLWVYGPSVWCHTKDSVLDFHYRYYYSMDYLRWLCGGNTPDESYYQCGFEANGMGKVHIVEKEIAVYPNPTSDMLTVYGLSSPECKYKVVSMSGVVVSEGFISHDNSLIDMSGFRKGTYLLWICDGEQTTIKKIVKL